MTKEECELPSYNASKQFLETGQMLPLAQSYLGRASIVSVAFLITGKDLRTSVTSGLIASAAIQMYVLYKANQFIKRC